MGVKFLLSAFILMLSVKHQQKPMSTIEGLYKGTNCKMSIELKATKHGFSYHLLTSKRNQKGIAIVGTDGKGHQKQYFIELKGSSMDEPSELRKNPHISFSLSADTITIQNTGNSMNYYVQLQECDQKYITLLKSRIKH